MDNVYVILYHFYDDMGYQTRDYTLNLKVFPTRAAAVKELTQRGYQHVTDEQADAIIEESDILGGDNDAFDMIAQAKDLNATDTILNNGLVTATIVELDVENDEENE